MSESITVFKLRKQWFKLQATNFIKRYATGLVVIAIFLPGVAIGDNFNILMTAVTKPFVMVSQEQSGFFNRMIYLLLLQVIFVVWARAQQYAISGGEFVKYMKTLPLAERTSRQHDTIMLLVGNHLLWPIMIYGCYLLLNHENGAQLSSVLRYGYLLFLLVLTQYISLFALNKSNIIMLLILSVGLSINTPWSQVWLVILIIGSYITTKFLHITLAKDQAKNRLFPIKWIPRFLSENLHYQMLFKANHTPVFFRLLLMLMLMGGFVLISDHIKAISRDNLMPYAMTLEALLAYYLSGFYVIFRDERAYMSSMLLSLPVHILYWPVRDVFALFVISIIIHTPFLWWHITHIGFNHFFSLMAYHLFLLMVCYPLRKLNDDKQTLIAFVVLFIITAVSIYHLS